MAVGGREDRILSGGPFGGRRRRGTLALALLMQRVLEVREPMTHPLILGPSETIDDEAEAWEAQYATDLHQRLFVHQLYSVKQRRSISLQGQLYHTPDISAEPASWSAVSGTETGVVHGQNVYYEKVDVSVLVSTGHFGMYTYAWQEPKDFKSPWTVVHEFWGNGYRASRSLESLLPLPAPSDMRSQSIDPKRTKLLGGR